MLFILGSSVATSLAQGESIEKKVGILKIHHDKFIMKSVPLRTVRPFIYRDVVLKTAREMEEESTEPLTASELTINLIKSQIDSMIEESKTLGKKNKFNDLFVSRPLNETFDTQINLNK